jgi:hypothetical protein
MTLRVQLVLLLAVAFQIGAATSTIAQSVEVTSRITDPTGAIVRGATVIVTNLEDESRRQLISNDEGYYSAPFLRPGTYRLTVQLPGFMETTQDGLGLSVGQIRRVDVVLTPEGVHETLNVQPAPALDRDESRSARSSITARCSPCS